MTETDGKVESAPNDVMPAAGVATLSTVLARTGGIAGIGRWLRTATGALSAAVTLIAGILTVVFLLRPALRPDDGGTVYAASLMNPTLEQGVSLSDYYARRGLPPDSGFTAAQLSQVGNLVSFDVVIEGYKGKTCRIIWSLLEAGTKQRVSNADFVAQKGWPVGFFKPEGQRDQASGEVWVPRIDQTGTYFIRLELFDPDGVRLTSLDSDSFTIAAPTNDGPAPAEMPQTSKPSS